MTNVVNLFWLVTEWFTWFISGATPTQHWLLFSSREPEIHVWSMRQSFRFQRFASYPPEVSTITSHCIANQGWHWWKSKVAPLALMLASTGTFNKDPFSAFAFAPLLVLLRFGAIVNVGTNANGTLHFIFDITGYSLRVLQLGKNKEKWPTFHIIVDSKRL